MALLIRFIQNAKFLDLKTILLDLAYRLSSCLYFISVVIRKVEQESDSEQAKVIFHPLVPSLNACNSQGWGQELWILQCLAEAPVFGHVLLSRGAL